MRACAMGLLATLAAAPVPALAQAGADGSLAYALTNARIVVQPGRTIERGTVVIREGRIAAVGSQVAIPPDAERIDLGGLVVYPGLIDAASIMGVPPTHALGSKGDPHRQPQRLAAEVADLSDRDRAALRAAGITTVGLAFHGGTDSTGSGAQFIIAQRDQPGFPGRTAVLNVGSGPTASLVIRSPVAVQVGFGTRRIDVYPTTLMGAIAFVHQTFLDAAYPARHRAAYAADPKAVPLPPHRPDLDALAPAAAGEQTVWITVSQENNIERALDLAAELRLDVRLLGAQEGYRMVDRLAREGKPVLVSLDYPTPARTSGHSFEHHALLTAGRADARVQADSIVARALRGNAAALHRAGVPVVLTSYGLRNPAEFLARVRGAVEAGLPADAALRALTLAPAAELGVSALVGSVEAGKLANLVITDGDLFRAGTRIHSVFVAGRRYDVSPGPARTAEEAGE